MNSIMEKNKVHAIMMQYRDLIDPENLPTLKNALERVDDSVYEELLLISTKSPITTLLLSVFCGGLGVDRFYLGDVGLGVTKLLLITLLAIPTFGLISIWSLLDIYFCYRKAKEINFKNIMQRIAM